MRSRWSRRLLWCGILGSLLLVNPYVRGDGNGYYAWLVSPVIDGDLDFENQYRHGDPFFQSAMFEPDGRRRAAMVTPTGRLGDQWSVGPAVLWSPWFLAAHGVTTVARVWVPSLAADGYSWPYRYACAIGTAVYGWLAVLFALRASRALGHGAMAPVAAVVFWSASPLPIYQFFLPFHVHALSAFVVSWFVWRWLALRPIEGPRRWIEWGALGGLITLVYQINAVMLVLAAYELIGLARRRGAGDAIRAGLWFGVAALVVFVPQFVGKAVVYGTPWTTGYGDEFFWTSPRLWQTAFSAEHGLFSWTPMALAGLAGLFLASRRRHEVRVLVLASAVTFYVIASYQNWHGQSSFGNRFFVSLFVCGVIGCADLLWSVSRTSAGALRAVLAGAAVFVLWNAGLAVQWGTGLIPIRGPVDFRTVARNQVTAVPGAAVRFLRVYVWSRDDAIHAAEERDKSERRGYNLVR